MKIQSPDLGGGVLTLLIKRENYENIQSNDSDALVDNYDYDYIIPNATLEELENEAINFVEKLNELEAKR